MWDTVVETTTHLSHEMPCRGAGTPRHSFLPCSDRCDCSGRGASYDEEPGG